MGCFGPDSPDARNYGQETKDTLAAQLEVMPEWVASEKQYRPELAQLDMDIAKRLLPDAMSLYRDAQPTLSAMERASQALQVAGDLDLLQRFSGDVTQAIRGAAGNATLMDLLTKDAEAGLESGGVDPWLAAQTAQQMRAGQASRGMMMGGQPAASMEALYGAERMNALRNQARMFGAQVVGLNQATGGDASMVLLGRPSQTLRMAPGAANAAAGYNPGNVFNPESPYAGNVYASNAAYDWQYKQSQPSTMARIGQVANTVGSVAGGLAKGFALCWVAREVYGANDPAWRVFKSWLMLYAPPWFRSLYGAYGEAFAAWIADKPRVKRWIRRWMDQRILGMADRAAGSFVASVIWQIQRRQSWGG